ncbi:Uncharacterised protein [Mycobacteroides abscessus subsp. abscessus]|nr:Uncharacterised protein [Mycobacteroides abscessus subsp. abscessus]
MGDHSGSLTAWREVSSPSSVSATLANWVSAGHVGLDLGVTCPQGGAVNLVCPLYLRDLGLLIMLG